MSPSNGWAPGRSVLQGMRYSKCFSLSSLSFSLLLPTEEKLMMVQLAGLKSEGAPVGRVVAWRGLQWAGLWGEGSSS